MNKLTCILVCSCGLLMGILGGVTAETFEKMPVERLDLQAKLLRAVLKFSTRQLDQVTVGILYVDETAEIAQTFAAEIEKLTYQEQPITTVLIKTDQLDLVQESVNVLYVTPGNAAFLDVIFELAVAKKLFSCSGIPEYVKNGKIVLGFGENKGKPQLILNLAVAKLTDHDFKNPKFLNLQTTKKLLLIK